VYTTLKKKEAVTVYVLRFYTASSDFGEVVIIIVNFIVFWNRSEGGTNS